MPWESCTTSKIQSRVERRVSTHPRNVARLPASISILTQQYGQPCLTTRSLLPLKSEMHLTSSVSLETNIYNSNLYANYFKILDFGHFSCLENSCSCFTVLLRPVRRGSCFRVFPKYEIDLLITAILIHVCLAHSSCQGFALSAWIHISTGVLQEN